MPWRLHQHVGEEEGEGLVADELAGAPDRVPESERLLLAREARASRLRQIGGDGLKLGGLAARGKHLLELELPVEMVLDGALVAARHEDEMLDAGFPRLVDHMLDERPVDDGQHLLGNRLGRGQKAGAEPCHREHGLTNASSHSVLVGYFSPAQWG